MNFVDEINAFERWLETNHLSNLSQLLWYKLFMLYNRSGWNEWISVGNLRLMSMIGVSSEKSFIKYRDELINAKLFQYIRGKKGCPNRYKYLSFKKCTVNFTVQTEVKKEVETKVQKIVEKEVQPPDIYKQNKTKQNNNKKEYKEKAKFETLICDFTDNENLKIAINNYIQMRIGKKKEPTYRALELVLKKLCSFTNDTSKQIKILENSTINNWTDIYQITDGDKNGGNSSNINNFRNNTFRKESSTQIKNDSEFSEGSRIKRLMEQHEFDGELECNF